jgi:WD40 repeat protein
MRAKPQTAGIAAIFVASCLGAWAVTPETRPTARRDVYGDPLPNGATSRMGTVRFRHGGRITQLAFSPDGKTIYSASPDDKVVRAWEAASGRELKQFPGKGGIWSVAVTPDGRQIITGEDGGLFRIWDTSSGREVKTLTGAKPQDADDPQLRVFGLTLESARLSGDGKTFVTAKMRENTLVVWDVAKAAETRRIACTMASPTGFDLSADGKVLLVANQNLIDVWDLPGGKQLRQLRGHEQAVSTVAISPDGKTAATFSQGSLRWWDVTSGKEIDNEELTAAYATLTFSPDGKLLAVSHHDAEGGSHVSIYDVATREESVTLDGYLAGVSTVAFSPDGKTLATGSGLIGGQVAAVRLWDVATGKEIRPLRAHPGAATTIAVSPDGKLVASCSTTERVVRIWDVATGREVRRLEGHEAGVDEVQFSADGRLLASATREPVIMIWEVATGRRLRTLADHNSLGPHMRFSTDGKTLATAGDQQTAAIWDVHSGQMLQTFTQPPDGVGAVLAYAGGKVLAFERVESENGEEAVIVLWDLVSGRSIRRFTGHKEMINGIALSADGRMIASRAEDRTIRVWEVSTGAERAQFADPGQGSNWTGTQFLAFSPDARLLATCGPDDADIRVWDLAANKALPPLTGHRGWVGAVEFSADGRTLVSGSQDTSCIAWDVSREPYASPRREQAPTIDLTASAMATKWDALHGHDAEKPYRAMWEIIAGGDNSVAFLRDQLPPVPATDPRQIARWIADLDHANYQTRERATTALTQVADQAESALRVALARTTSAEVRQRIRRILEAVSEGEPTPDRLRNLRCVEILERIASPAARELLAALSRGAADAVLTRQAAESLKRLDNRQ